MTTGAGTRLLAVIDVTVSRCRLGECCWRRNSFGWNAGVLGESEMVRVVLLKAVFVLLMLLGTEHASAHSWYPDRCCNGHDCRKVDKIDYLADGSMLMHAGAMDVFIPRYFVQGLSEDGDAHVCAVSIAVDVYIPVCVFMPGII